MRLKTIKVKNFRRFSDLTVDRIPETARLIVLVGPNGCGKSSFFDALAEWNFFHGREEFNWDVGYHRKVGSVQPDQWTGQEVEIECHSSSISAYSRKDAFYFRSAYRNDPDFQIRSLERMGRLVDAVNIRRMIESDAAVSRNYKRMAARTLLDLYGMEKDEITIGEYREQQFGRIQTALQSLFPDLHLDGLGDPLKDGTFLFTKGESRGFQFKNLSGGEKASFDLILDLTVALQEYNDTVFCIDEPDSHMNTRLQAKLLDTLYELMPIGCQLMIATHSVGMIRQARDIEEKTPGAVVFLDFGGRDFDHRQNIYPIKPDRRFWKNVYRVALDDLASLIAPRRIVICEGQPQGSKSMPNEAHDARCYTITISS